MTRNHPQHNFMIAYPVGRDPWLREPEKWKLKTDEMKADANGDPIMSDDNRIIILDPWIDLLPKAYRTSEHTGPTNLGTFDLGFF